MKTFDYSTLPEDVRDSVALNHFAQHVGEIRWASLVAHAEAGNFPTKEYFRDTCAILLEVEDFPVEAFVRKYLSSLPEQGQPLVVKVEPLTEEQRS